MQQTSLRWLILSLGLWMSVSGVLVGCSNLQEASEQESNNGASASQSTEASGLNLASSSDDVRTIQLYRDGQERQLPILALRSASESLTLEFDLMVPNGRPLSIYFYHADRDWRRDLSPAEYLASFQHDDLIDYIPSRSTEVPYTHYVYQFPNDDIDFRVSGNYILRITEQGQRNRVLFERPFFVTEEAGPLQLGIQDVIVSGQRQPSDQPIARFTPPPDLQGDPFQYDVCFVRNGQLEAARCTDRPRLAEQPLLEFDLLRERAFAPAMADYFLDMANLNLGNSIERIDRAVSPFHVILKPDYARFSGTPLAPLLEGQIVVQDVVRDVANPDIEAEYVRARFSFVPPDEQPLGGEVVVAGSFSDGRYGDDYRMQWVSKRSRYEGEVLLKQGHYEYYYGSDDPALQKVLRETFIRTRDRYTAFVYYSDVRLQTDRLLAVQGVRTQ